MKTTRYNSVVSGILKEDLTGLMPVKPSFGMTVTKIYLHDTAHIFMEGLLILAVTC